MVKSDDKSHEVSGRKGADSQDIVTEVSTNDQHVDDLNNLKVTNPPPVATTKTTVAAIKTTKIPRIKTTTVAKSSRFVFFYLFILKNLCCLSARNHRYCMFSKIFIEWTKIIYLYKENFVVDILNLPNLLFVHFRL